MFLVLCLSQDTIFTTLWQRKITTYCRFRVFLTPSLSLHSGVDLVENLSTSPRLIKTHFPVQFVPKSFWEQNCKVSCYLNYAYELQGAEKEDKADKITSATLYEL